MAVSIINPATGLFDPYTRDKEAIGTVLRLGLFGKAAFPRGTSLIPSAGSAAAAADIVNIKKQTRTAQVMCARLLGRRGVDFKGVFDTSDASALAVAFSLTTLGVTFPAATLRTISLFMISSNDAETIYQEIEQDVWGNNGTTPKLGDARIKEAYKVLSGTYQKLGRVHLKTDEAGTEATDGMNSAGIAVAGLTAGTGVVALPLHRAFKVLGTHYGAGTYAAASGNDPHIASIVGSAGTARIDVARPSDGALTVPAAGFLDVELELWPQAQVQLVLNANAVEVHLRTTVADIYRHRIEVFAGPALSNALSA